VKNYGKSIRLRNGGLEISKLLEHHNVDYLGVAFADEGIIKEEGGIYHNYGPESGEY
jgi:alanine racemase